MPAADDEEELTEEESPAKKALEARLAASDVALFLLLHCRHDPTSHDASAFEEAWIHQDRRDADSDTESVESGHAAHETPPASPPTSPRSARSAKRASLELCLRARAAAEATRLQWVTARLETMLRLVAAESLANNSENDLSFSPVSPIEQERACDGVFARNSTLKLTRAEFDRLSFLLRPIGDCRSRLSELCPLFARDETASTSALANWLSSAVHPDDDAPLFAGKMFGGDRSLGIQASRSLCSSATTAAKGGSAILIVDARRCTRIVVDDNEDDARLRLRDCRIVGCRDVRIYILTATRYVDVVGCVDSLVVVGAVARQARLVACERTHVVAAASRAVVSSCLSCCFSLYSPFSPLLDGDNRSCRVAPYCAVYDGARTHLARARLFAQLDPEATAADQQLSAPPNMWRAPLRLAPAVNRGLNFARSPVSSESLGLAPADFELVVAPFATHETALPFPLPAEYAAALEAKRDRAEAIKQRIAEATLTTPQRAKVEAAAKAAFARWLVDSKVLRHLGELMHLEHEHDQVPSEPSGL